MGPDPPPMCSESPGGRERSGRAEALERRLHLRAAARPLHESAAFEIADGADVGTGGDQALGDGGVVAARSAAVDRAEGRPAERRAPVPLTVGTKTAVGSA